MLAALLLASFTCSFAQKLTVKGTVTDDENYPLISASVVIEGTTSGTTTDANGNFSLPVSVGQKLVFSYIGYQTQTITVKEGKETYEVTLKVDATYLSEVVVVGYDVQKKVNLTGSVASVSSEVLSNRPIASSTTALQGIAPGVTVTTRSGAPGGDGGNIRVRGIGTFGGSSAAPLVLIDGVQGSLDAIDATQIDKISVLKDAASSAIYGSRAANGVILVTTKRGKAGFTQVQYDGYVGWSTPTNLSETVNAHDFMVLSRETSVNDGSESIYTDDYIANYDKYHAIDPDNYPLTNWKKAILTGSGFSQNHTLNLTTSNDKISVMTSLGYMNQQGIIKLTDFNRYNIRNNMTVQLSKNLVMKLDLAAMSSDRNYLPQQSGLFMLMNVRDPLILTKYSTGYYAMMSGGSVNSLPALEGLGGDIRTNKLNLNGSMTLTYDPADWLTIEGKIAPRWDGTFTHKYVNKMKLCTDAFGTVASTTNVAFNNLTESSNRLFYGNYQGTMALHKQFGDHALKLLLGASRETYDGKYLSAYRQDFAYPDYEVISAGADNETKDNSGSEYEWVLQSYFARLNYNYKERYLFEANFRADGSSRFSEGHQWGYFPSFSAAWRISEEEFMENAKSVLSDLKLRGSYGRLGNQNIASEYPAYELLATGSISMNGNILPIVTMTTLANKDISWETSEMTDIGLDATLFGKLDLTADWYYKTTYDILMQLDIAKTIGLSAPYQNAGTVRNVGWEVSASYNDQWGDFSFGAQANLSDVDNMIVDMKGTTGGSGVIRNQEGHPINSLYGFKCLGIARTQEAADEVNNNCRQFGTTIKAGDLIYADMDGNGVINDDDKTFIGSTIPRFTYGLMLNFGWKGFGLSAFFQGVGMADGYLNSYYVMPCQQGGTFRQEHLDRWTPENTNGTYPRLTLTSLNNWKDSDFWIRSSAYCRLKNIQLSYTLPKDFVRHLSCKSVMFYVNAQNLLTFTNFYQGYDPEVNYDSGASDGVSVGAVANNYPQVKTVTVGVDLKF